MAMYRAIGDPDAPMLLASLLAFMACLVIFPLCLVVYYSFTRGRQILRVLDMVILGLIVFEAGVNWWPHPDIQKKIALSSWSSAELIKEPTNIEGEWAITWQDLDSNYQETFYVTLSQEQHQITGEALDSYEIPANIVGSVAAAQIRFIMIPERGITPYQSYPRSFFQGDILTPHSMEGTWEIEHKHGLLNRGAKGVWNAIRSDVMEIMEQRFRESTTHSVITGSNYL
jgi:ABC-type sugar transport system permease subunit